MKTEEEINCQKNILRKRLEQAIDENCFQDARELGAMLEIINWILRESEVRE